MEILLACILLWSEDYMTQTEYEEILHKLFLEHPEDEFLLELEWNSADFKQTIALVHYYYLEHIDIFDSTIFGSFLFEKLYHIFLQEENDIQRFAEKMYKLWTSLPPLLQHVEPFHALCYADDPLSWGDEQQTKQIYINTFSYYRGTNHV